MSDIGLWLGARDANPILPDGRSVRDTSPGAGDQRDEQPGRCLEFNGTSQAIDCGDSDPFFSLTGDWSLCCHVNFADFSGVQAVISQYRTSGDNRTFMLYSTGSDVLRVRIESVAPHTSYVLLDNLATSTLSADKWYSVCCDRSGGVFRYYLDNVLQDTHTDVDGTRPMYQTGNMIGARANSSSYNTTLTDFFAGKIFGVQVFDRVLTDGERSAMLLQSRRPWSLIDGQPQDPVRQYYLDDDSTSVSMDSSGSGIDGSIVNGAAGMLYEGSDVPWSAQNLIGFSD